MQIDGAVALVTGGGRGLGLAVAQILANRGARVAILDRDEDAAKSAAQEIGALALSADVANADQVSAAFAKTVEEYGESPRIVVSCAGVGTAARILPRDGSLSIEAFVSTVSTNLVGTYVVLSIAAREMSQLPTLDEDGARGVVVNTSSIAYQDGQIGQAAYAASKGGIASLTLPAARELARVGIRVVTIAPGLFSTPMSADLPDDIRAELVAKIPFPPRMGNPSEFAQLVMHAVENQMLNGTTIRLDGGVRMTAK